MQRQIRQRARAPIRGGVRPVEWSLMGMRVVTLGAEQRKTDRDAGSGSGSWGGDAFWSPHSSYAIVPSRPTCPRRRMRKRWVRRGELEGELGGAGGPSGDGGTAGLRWRQVTTFRPTPPGSVGPPTAGWDRRQCRRSTGSPGRLHSPFSNDVVCLLDDSRQVCQANAIMMGPPQNFRSCRKTFGAQAAPFVSIPLYQPLKLSISPPGRWPAVEVPNSTLTGPRPTRHHVSVVANLALTSH